MWGVRGEWRCASGDDGLLSVPTTTGTLQSPRLSAHSWVMKVNIIALIVVPFSDSYSTVLYCYWALLMVKRREMQ